MIFTLRQLLGLVTGVIRFEVVPGPGLEPGRYFYRGILSPLRLPISPSGHKQR